MVESIEYRLRGIGASRSMGEEGMVGVLSMGWAGYLRMPPRHGGKWEGREGSSEIAFDTV